MKLIVLGFGFLMEMAASAQWQYPATKTVDAADTYFGHTYKDPYRWLENLQDKEVAAWFKAQAELTDRLLAKIPRFRHDLMHAPTTEAPLSGARFTRC